VFAVAAAINGVVGIIQSTLSPQQLASWGPGYHKLLVSSVGPNGQSYGGATYVTASGQNAVRPPALGGFVGFGGTLGMLALPFALALGVGSKRRYDRIIAVICLPLIIAGVFTSQTRSAVVGAVVIVAAFVVLLSVRQSARAAPAVFVGVIALGLVLTLGLSLGRYSSIAPAKLVSTFGSARGGSIGLIPRYATTYPFGAGLGTAGPGVVAAASVHAGKLDGENSYTYLIVELGLPGLLCVIALLIAAIRRGGRLVLSRVPPDARLYLAAVTAGLIGCTVESLDGGITSAPPESTFIWLAVGIIAAWSIHAPTPILRLLPRK
jgi:O-antigen ligase